MAAYIVFETGHTFGPSMLYPVYRSVIDMDVLDPVCGYRRRILPSSFGWMFIEYHLLYAAVYYPYGRSLA